MVTADVKSNHCHALRCISTAPNRRSRGAWSADGASLLLQVQTLGNDDAARLTFTFTDRAVEVTFEAAEGYRMILKGRTDG